MSGIILPDSVRLRMEFDDQLESMNERHAWLRHFDRELRAIDKHLSLVKASENATQPGLEPGYWHIKRDNPTTLPTFIPLRNDKGGFSEPTSAHLELLRRNDMQRSGAFEEFKKQQDALETERQRRKQAAADERREEMAERIEAAERVSVSMNDGWKNSVKGRTE